MSNTDSFIDEITEEVRRDRLFALFRRWAWLAILLVVLLVGGASYIEWRRSAERASAEALGAEIMSALALEDAAARAEALAAIEAREGAAAVTAMIAAAELAAAGERQPAITALEPVVEAEVERRYVDLAELKRMLLAEPPLPPEVRIGRLEALTAPGAPYRLLALEQIALARIELGQTEPALAILRDILADNELTGDLRRRVSQLIVALGGEIEAG